MRRPSLTAKTIEGLNKIYSLARVEFDSGPEGSSWVENKSGRELEEIESGIKYLGDLIGWYYSKEKK